MLAGEQLSGREVAVTGGGAPLLRRVLHGAHAFARRASIARTRRVGQCCMRARIAKFVSGVKRCDMCHAGGDGGGGRGSLRS